LGYPNLPAIYDDVEKGLESQQHRLNDAAMSQAFWDYQGKRFMQVFLKDAETPFDYVQRPYRASGILRQVIKILCEHLYSPGPSRTWDKPAGNEFLQTVYEDNHFDAIMQRADQLSSLNDVAAIQVDADEGNFQDKPITLRLWGAQDFHLWCDPDNRTIPKVAVTIDRFDHATTYRLWTDTEVRIYETPKNENIEGNRVAKQIGPPIPHKYGCLPFASVHYEQPITSFWETGIGGFLTQSEIRVNDRLSRLDESINKHLNPLPVAENVDPTWQLIIEPQRFIRIDSNKMRPGPTGGIEDGPPVRLYYLEAHIDSTSAWDDLIKYVNQVFQALNIPAAMYRSESIGMASGIALVVEQAPLLTRARARRKPFSLYETAIARLILRCSGNHYGRSNLVTAAKDGKLALGWPQPTVPVPTADNLDLAMRQVSAGIMSLPMLCQQWYGMDREQSFMHLEQVEADNAELAKRAPTIAAAVNPQEDDDQGGDDQSSDKGDDELSGEDEDNQSRDL
jgi:Phage portal protein, SPP1 Gp6-like